MRKNKIFLPFVLIALLAVLWSACSKQKSKDVSSEVSKIITVATDATWPPMEFINEQKEIIGFDIDVINAIAKAGNFKIEIRNVAWDGIFAGLANGSYDAVISAVTITEERKQAMDFSAPYINAGQVLIVPQASEGITTLKDLAGFDVGAQIGTTGAIAVRKVDGPNLKTYDELGLAISDLANGKLAAVVADTPIAADYALNNDTYRDRLKIVGEPFTEEFYGIAVQKDNQVLLEQLNKGLKNIQDSGELDQLIQKWLK